MRPGEKATADAREERAPAAERKMRRRGGSGRFRLALRHDGREDEVENDGHSHAVDGGQAPLHAYETGDSAVGRKRDEGAHSPRDGGRPREGDEFLLSERHIVRAFAEEVVRNQEGAARRDEGVEDVQPAAEVVVEPDGRNGAERAVEQHHKALGQPRDVRDAQTRGVKRVVVGRPDVQTQHEDGGQQ